MEACAAVESGAVYNATTEPRGKAPRRPCGCSARRLRGGRLPAKALQAILSLLAVICEEIVEGCIKCEGLYFFEFTSCSAFLLSLLILCVYFTDMYEALGEDKVERVNFGAMLAIGACFLVASVVFAATSSGTAVENAACAFGFLASGAFLAEFTMDYFHRRKQNVSGHPENPASTQSGTENQPLNRQS